MRTTAIRVICDEAAPVRFPRLSREQTKRLDRALKAVLDGKADRLLGLKRR